MSAIEYKVHLIALPGCGGVYYERDGHTECCSGELIDNRASKCVFGIVTNIRNGKYYLSGCFLYNRVSCLKTSPSTDLAYRKSGSLMLKYTVCE